MHLYYAVDNYLGDIHRSGVYLGVPGLNEPPAALPGTKRIGDFTQEYELVRNITPYVSYSADENALWFYVNDEGGDAGIIFSAVIDVYGQVQPPPHTISFHSGNSTGGNGSPDTLFHMLIGPADGPFSLPFTHNDFVNAHNGVSPKLTAPNGAWGAFPGGTLAKWINDTGAATTTGSSGLYAIDFDVPVDGQSQVIAADLQLRFTADNGLGTTNVPGIYVNETPLSGAQQIGDFTGSSVYRNDISGYLNTPGTTNTLYIYLRDDGGPAGLIFAGTITYDVMNRNVDVPAAGRPGSRDALVARPNPATSAVRLWLTMSSASRVTVDVYDLGGRKVRRLHDGFLDAGSHEFGWDRRDANGQRLPAGIYLVSARTASDTRVARVAVIQ